MVFSKLRLSNVSHRGKLRQSSRQAKRQVFRQSLQLETLERRELLAGDVMHNRLIPEDTNGDFRVTPLDALGVINHINAARRNSAIAAGGEGEAASSDEDLMLDVNNDSTITPLDMLSVINAVNHGESEPFLAALNTLLVDDADNPLPSVVAADGVTEYTIGLGQNFQLRTQVQDLRTTDFGVFQAIIDVNLDNLDDTTEEKIALDYGERQQVVFDLRRPGTFTLVYDGIATGPITVDGSISDLNQRAAATAASMEAAVRARFGGNSDITVVGDVPFNDVNGYFDIRFTDSLRRTNVPNASLGANNLVGSPLISVNNFNPPPAPPIDRATAITAYDFPLNTPTSNEFFTPFRFDFDPPNQFGQFGYGLVPAGAGVSAGTYQLNEIGGTNEQPSQEYESTRFLNVVDASFFGNSVGALEITTDIADEPGQGIILFGGATQPLPEMSIRFSPKIRVNVVARLSATNDTLPVTGDTPNPILEDGGSVPITFDRLTANDFALPGTTIVRDLTIVTPPDPATGSLTRASNGVDLVFTPATDFFGPTTFQYQVRNNLGDTSTATVTINVTNVNDAPQLLENLPTLQLAEQSSTPLTVLASDFFRPGPAGVGAETGTVRFTAQTAIITPDTGATAQVDTNGNLVVTAPPDFNGQLVIRAFAVDDEGAVGGPFDLTVNITPVNDVPVALTPNLSVAEDTSLTITAAQLFGPGGGGFEAGQTITLSSPVVTGGDAVGTLTASNGGLLFTPAQDFFGNVEITVTGTDDGTPNESTTTTFNISVTPVNDQPLAIDDSVVAFSQTGMETELFVLNNDSPGPANEGQTLQITRVFNQTNLAAGTIRIAADGRSVFYRPTAGSITGTDSFSYEVSDGGDLISTDTASVNVTIAPPQLPFAVPDNETISEGTASLTIDVLANDLLNANAAAELVSFSQPSAGTVTRDPGNDPNSTADDRLVFTPADENFNGTVSFTYILDDNAADSEPSEGRVSITVTEVNDPPTLQSPAVQNTTEDIVDFRIPRAVLIAGATTGPANEASQTPTVIGAQIVSGGGNVRLDGEDILFTAATDSVADVTIEYTVTDNGTTAGQLDPQTATARFIVRLAPINDPPIARDDTTVNGREDTDLAIPVVPLLANDSVARASATDELASQSLQLVGVRVVSGGGQILSFNQSEVIYRPAPNYNGPVVLDYTVRDVQNNPNGGFVALESSARVSFTVREVNDAPGQTVATRQVFSGISTRVNIAAELAATPRGDATDALEANQSLRVDISRGILTQPAVGTATLNADGSITYFADQGTDTTVTIVVGTIDDGTTLGQAEPQQGTAVISLRVQPFLPSTVSGVVHVDDNGDTAVDALELRLTGVTVVLSGTTVGTGAPINRTAVTNSAGQYFFEVLPPGVYTVSYVQPAMTIDGPSPNSVTSTVEVPGGASVVANFGVTGIDARFISVLDNLSEGIYGTYPQLRNKGIDAVIGADGRMNFSILRGGFDGVVFSEVNMTPDGRNVVVTVVDDQLRTSVAFVPRGKWVLVRDDAGNSLIRIISSYSELSFSPIATPPDSMTGMNGLSDSVDAFFAQYGA